MEQKTERQGRAYAGNCDPEPQGLARDPAQAVRHQKGKLKDPLSVLDVPSERGFCCLYHVLPPQNQAVLGSIRQYLTAAKNEKPAKLRVFNVTSRVLYGASSDTAFFENHRSTICFLGHRIATCLYRTPMGGCIEKTVTFYIPHNLKIIKYAQRSLLPSPGATGRCFFCLQRKEASVKWQFFG